MHPSIVIRSVLSGLFTCLFFASSFGQKTQVYEQNEERYYHGVELYDKEIFGPAIEEFEQFISREPQSSLLTEKANVYAMLCHLQLDHKNYDRKLDYYLKHNQESSLNNLVLFELGNYHFNNKKYKKAARYYEDLSIGNLPKIYWEEANFKMGYSFFKAKDYDKAKAHLNKIRNQKGEYYVEANYFYGYICYVKFDFDCALQSFERIKDQGPEIMHLYIAQIYYAQKGYKPALDYAEKHRNDKYKEEYDLLEAKCHFQLEEFDEAYPFFNEIDPYASYLSDEDIYMLGFTQYLKGNHEKAQQAFVRISGLESGLGQLANYQLGQSFLAIKDKQKAFHALGVAKRMSFNEEIQEIAHFNYAKLAFELGAQNNAIQSTQEFIAKYPKSAFRDKARQRLAEMLVTTNNYSQAIRVLEEVQNFDESSKSTYQKVTYNRAEQLFTDRNYGEAQVYFNKSLRFTPDKLLQAQAYYWLGEIEFIDKRYASARTNYSRMFNISAATKSAYYHQALYSMGYTYYMEQDVNKALNYFNKYDQTANDRGSAVYNDNAIRLGDSYFLKKQYDKAIKAYAKVADGRYKESDYALFQTGILYGLSRNYEKKVQTLHRIESSFPKSSFVDDALFEIGDTYFKYLKQPEKALTLFNRIINGYKGSIYVPASHVKIANIFFQSGDDEKTIEYCKTVIKEFPNTSSSKEAYDLGEAASIKTGTVDEWFAWCEDNGSGNLRITYQDSVLYESSLQKYRLGNCEEASKGFNSYLKRFGKAGYFATQANYFLAECAYLDRAYDKAVEHYKYVADQSLSEYLEDATYKLAELLYWQKKYTQALPYFSKLERIASTKDHFTSAVVGQMRCNYTLGNTDAAKKNATDVLPIENVETEYLIEANLILGKIQYEAENYLTSMFHLDFVVKESNTEEGAEAQYYRCLVLYKQGKNDESREAIFDMSDNYASYEYWVVKGFVLLSDIYVSEKDYFQARATLQSLREAYTGDQAILDEINQRLAELDKLENSNGEDTEDNEDSEESGE